MSIVAGGTTLGNSGMDHCRGARGRLR